MRALPGVRWRDWTPRPPVPPSPPRLTKPLPAEPKSRRSRAGCRSLEGRSQRVVTRISTNSASTSIEAALAGEGIARTLSYQVVEHLAEGRLVRLLRQFEPPATPVHVVHTSGPGRLGPARALIDMLVPRLRGALRAIDETMGA